MEAATTAAIAAEAGVAECVQLQLAHAPRGRRRGPRPDVGLSPRAAGTGRCETAPVTTEERARPTAREINAALAERGVHSTRLTLHVGAGTFQPVRVHDLSEHKMHTEAYFVPQATVDAIAATRAAGKRVVCVGTTSMRALESAARQGPLAAGEAEEGFSETRRRIGEEAVREAFQAEAENWLEGQQ